MIYPNINDEFSLSVSNDNFLEVKTQIDDHEDAAGTAHAVVTSSQNGFMSTEHLAKVELIDITGTGKKFFTDSGEYKEIDDLSIKNSIISILSDSYGTYGGWVPVGYDSWYKDSGNSGWNDVNSVTDTWWWKLCRELGFSLLKTSSYSGAPICNTGYNASDASAFSFVTRMKADMGETNVTQIKPNIIFILGGTNDQWAGAPLGSLQYSGWTLEDLKKTLPAFCYMLDYIKKYNPGARIYNIVNTDLNYPITSGMETACIYYEVSNVVLQNIDKQTGHPSKLGMSQIKDQVKAVLYSPIIIRTALLALLKATKLNKDSYTAISVDGKDVSIGSKWTTRAVYDKLDAAYNAANVVCYNPKSTQEDVDNYTSSLANANIVYNSAKQFGSDTSKQVVIVSDTFTRADSATVFGNAETGQVWNIRGTYGISSNKGKCMVSAAESSVHLNVGGYGDYETSADFIHSSYSAIMFRCGDSANNYRLRLTSDGLGLFKIINNVGTKLGNYDVVPVVGNLYNLKSIASGNSIRCYLNGALVISVIDDTYPNNKTKAGVYSGTDIIGTFDNFTVKTVY